MKYRPFPQAPVDVSEVGFGAWQLGNFQHWEGMTEDAALALVDAALERGCNFFDTAPNYGEGMSETLLGRALEGRRDQVVINSKCGHRVSGEKNWDPGELRRSVEGSLERLRTDYLDSLLLHNPPEEMLRPGSAQLRLLADLKAEGKIRAYGASVDFAHEIETALEDPGVEVLEVMFNIFHQEPLRMFARAREQGVALIIKVPLDSGWLSGRYDADSSFSDIRRRWSPEVLRRRAEALRQIQFLQTPERSLVQAALAFILRHEEVTTVIPGVKNLAQLETNLGARADLVTEEELARLHAVYAEHLADHLLPW